MARWDEFDSATLGGGGILQNEVTMARLKAEYGVDAIYEAADFTAARWIECDDAKKLDQFRKK